MEVGIVTIDGRQVGVVTQSANDDDPEAYGGEHAGRDWWSDLGIPRPHSSHAGSGGGHLGGRHYGHGARNTHGTAAHLSDRAHHHTSRGTPDHHEEDGAGEGLHGSAYLAARRERFAQEMRDNPQLREQVAGMMVTEGVNDPVPVVESLMNRMDYTGGSIERALHSGFYGPINRGELPAAIAQLHRNPRLRARMDRAIDAALAGSNEIRGATDQGLPTDPNGRWPGGRIWRGGNVYNDWGDGPGGHRGAEEYRRNLMRHVEEEAAAPPAPSAAPEPPAAQPTAPQTPPEAPQIQGLRRNHPEIHEYFERMRHGDGTAETQSNATAPAAAQAPASTAPAAPAPAPTVPTPPSPDKPKIQGMRRNHPEIEAYTTAHKLNKKFDPETDPL